MIFTFDNKFYQADEADYMFIFQIKHQYSFWIIVHILQGRIQDFKLGGGRKYLGYFVWKITILRQKILFFPMLGGVAPDASPLIRPCIIQCIVTGFNLEQIFMTPF